jgi:hypothetical protein
LIEQGLSPRQSIRRRAKRERAPPPQIFFRTQVLNFKLRPNYYNGQRLYKSFSRPRAFT